MDLEKALRKLSSRISGGKARKTLQQHLRENPWQTVQTIASIHPLLDPRDKEILDEILAAQAKRSPQLRTALYKAYTQGQTWTRAPLRAAGADPQTILELQQAIQKSIQQLSQELPEAARSLREQIAKIIEASTREDPQKTITKLRQTLAENNAVLQALTEIDQTLAGQPPHTAAQTVEQLKQLLSKKNPPPPHTLKEYARLATTLAPHGVSPAQLTTYLETIREKYGPQILERTIRTIKKAVPEHLETLKQEIDTGKPPYKTHLKTTKPHKPTTQPKQLWETGDLGGWVRGVAWSPSGDKLVASTRNKVVVFSREGRKLWETGDLGGKVYGVAWSPSGDKIAAGTGWEDEKGKYHGRVVVFSREGRKLWETGDLGGKVYGVAWSPSGDKLTAGTTSNRVVVFSREGRKLWETGDLGGYVWSVAWSPQGDMLAVGGDFKKVIVFSQDGQKLWESDNLGGQVSCVAWSPDGTRLAAGGYFNKVIVFSSGGDLLWDSGDLGDTVRGVAWSPQGDMLAVGGGFKRVIVFSRDGRKLWDSGDLGGYVWSVAWSPGGDKLTAGVSWGGYPNYHGRVIVFLVGLFDVCGFGGLEDVVGFGELRYGGDGVCSGLAGCVLGDCGGAGGLAGVVGDFCGFACSGDLVGALGVYYIAEGLGCPGCLYAGSLGALLWLSPYGLRSSVEGLLERLGFDAGLVWRAAYSALGRFKSLGEAWGWFTDFLVGARSVLSRALEAVGGGEEGVKRLVSEFLGAGRGFVEGLEDVVGLVGDALVYGEDGEGYLGRHVVVGDGELCNRAWVPVVVQVEGGLARRLRPGSCVPVPSSGSAVVEGPGGVRARVEWGVPPVRVERVSSTGGTGRVVASAGPVGGGRVELPVVLEGLPGGGPGCSGSWLVVGVGGWRLRGWSPPGECRVCRVGCGGWGCVYRCGDVVLKVPRGFEDALEGRGSATVGGRLLDRVVREAEVLSSLAHPHILRLVGYAERFPVLVYEYADLGSLEGQVAAGWEASVGEAVAVGVAVGDALRYIHSRGLVHGDIKAGNVLLRSPGVPLLGDFSSMKRLLARTSSRSGFAYTPGWRAPEQVDVYSLWRRSRELGYENRVDVYQLGNLILYLLTGETVDGEELLVEGDRALEPLDLVEDDRLRGLLSSMLIVEPWGRPSSEEVVARLSGILARLGG